MFCETRQSKKGEPLDQETTNAMAQLKDLIENSSQQPSEAFENMFGKEKPGRVRCHGRVTTPTLLKRKEEIAEIEKKHNEMKQLNHKVKEMEAKHKQEMSSMEQKFQILLRNVINQNNSGLDVDALAAMLSTPGTSTSTHVPNNVESPSLFQSFCNFNSVVLMESWSYVQEEKGYLFSDEMDFSHDAFMRSRKELVEWDNKASCNFETDGFTSDREVKSMEFVDLGFPDLFGKSFHGGQPIEISSCDLDSNSSKRGNSSTRVIALDSSLGEEESESKHLSTLVKSKTHDSSLIDLKLGRLADCQGASNDKIAKEGFTLSSIHPTTLAKRARTSSSPIQALVCQVYGCNMDLSSSKDYHKRHKVCDVHSKTAKVIVNGIEQRFCQQCSRFHLLAEFDDGKRSCRRRLSGHNERRRKPQILQSHQGTEYLGSSFQKRSQFAIRDIFRSGILFPGKYDQISQSGHVKLEDKSIYSSQDAAAITHGQESSSCAHSLLSAQSQNPFRHSARNTLASSLIFQGICLHNKDDQVSETPLGINPADKCVPTESFPCGMNPKEVIKNGSSILSDDNCQPSDLFDVKYGFSAEHGATVDLFQLSSNLQRVEQQRNVSINWENEDCYFSSV